jgi:hypothetical protein
MPDAALEHAVTGLYVYGVVPDDAAVPADLHGLDDSEVQLVRTDGLAAAVGEVSLDRSPGRRADLLAHSHVVDALAGSGVVVPVQFGAVLLDHESVVEEFLQPNAEHFAHLLESLAGTTQFLLRATYVEEQVLSEVVREHPEIAELRRRTRDLTPGTPHPDLVRLGECVSAALDGKRELDGAVLVDAIRPHILGYVERPSSGVDHVIDLALLVDKLNQQQLEDALEVLAEGVHDRIRLRLTGPVAPYDFVNEETWA